MAIQSNHGKPQVAKAPRPDVSIGLNKGTPHVASGNGKNLSVGKMPQGMGGVNLGTTHGKHNVAHRLSNPGGGSLQK